MVGTGFLECLEIGLWSTESQCVIRGMPIGNLGIFIFVLFFIVSFFFFFIIIFYERTPLLVCFCF